MRPFAGRAFVAASAASCAVVLSSFVRPADALFEDEVGSSDFLLSTAGHGSRGVTYASLTSDGSAVITSSSHPYPFVSDQDGGEDGVSLEDDPFGFAGDHTSLAGGSKGCYVSARSSSDGSLLWRRDACSNDISSSSSSVRHAAFASPSSKTVFTLDDAGTFRGWDESTGALKFDVGLTSGGDGFAPTKDGAPRLFGLDLAPDLTLIGAAAATTEESEDEALLLRSIKTGWDVSKIKAADALAEARVKPPKSHSVARVLGLVPAGGDGKAAALVGWTYSDDKGRSIASGSSIALVDVDVTSSDSCTIGTARAIKMTGDGARLGGQPLKASTMRVVSLADKTHVMAIASGVEDVITISIDHGSGGPSATARRSGLTELHPLWTSLTSVHPPTSAKGGEGSYYVRVAGDDDRYPTVRRTVALYHFDPSSGKIGKQLYEGTNYNQGEEETEDDAMVQCSDIKLSFEYDDDEEKTEVRAYRVKGEEVIKELTVSGDAASNLPMGGPLRADHSFVLRCSASGAAILATAQGGTTLFLSASFKSDRVALNVAWSAEEALDSISSATFLDESHVPAPTSSEEDEEEALLRGLTFTARLQSQLESVRSLFAGGALSYLTAALFSDGRSESRDRAFGFSKVAVLLNSRQHVLIGSDTGMDARGKSRWTKRLHPGSQWHRVVHGGPSSRVGSNGGHDTQHSMHGHEILVLSYVPAEGEGKGYTGIKAGEDRPGTLHWTCLDGLTGRVHSESRIKLTSSVAQILPLYGSHHHHGHVAGECRQTAAIMHGDDTVSVVPDTDRSAEVLEEAVASAKGGNGLYAHSLNRATGTFRSLKVEPSSSSSTGADRTRKATLVGEASFRPDRETVLSVTYPLRNEVVQSPATILGDDSLLLKYLNPHLCVVVTEATPEFLSKVEGDDNDVGEEGAFYQALGVEGKGSSGDAGSKTKPLGATKPGEESTAAAAATATKSPPPSLFVNVVDAVSGRVLYRASHSHVKESDAPGSAALPSGNVPVLISENWIVYAFRSARTQRTELAVLTLHEGMIDKNGITMLRSPDQDLSFSSLSSPRPVVLSKTFGMQTPVSALGVTTTRGGISVKHVLAATGPGGSVASIDRRMLDPRRPTGEPKQSEKVEGLVRYFPLMSLTTKLTPSYYLEVAGVNSIVSASAQVESQSLMLAFGGPDVFFARLSPSRGFDLLPDDFNRPLLSAVVVGLLAVVVTLKGMSKRKMAAVGWT